MLATDQEYREALAEASVLIDLDPEPDSEDGKKLLALVAVVEAYEADHYPVPSPDPVEAARFRAEQTVSRAP